MRRTVTGPGGHNHDEQLLAPARFEPTHGQRRTTAAEALGLLSELGELARASLPTATATATATAQANATAPDPAPAAAGMPTSAINAAPATPRPEYRARPEYQPALEDASLIQALLSLMPAEQPRLSTKHGEKFESSRPPRIQIEPKPLAPTRPRPSTGTPSIFKPRNGR